MVSMAAGMARTGLTPFVNTFAVFLTTRGADPIQSLIAYDKLNVKIAGTYCGLSDSYDGASHHGITDMSLMRSIPNMTVVCVSDPVETEKAVMAVADFDGPVYLRLSRAPAPALYSEDMKFEIGKGITVKDGADVALVCTGTVLHKAIEAAELLEKEGIHATVIDMHTVQPIDKDLLVAAAKKTGAVVTVEEHSIRGGLGSAVAEVLAAECPTPMEFVGATDFAESGDYDELLEKYGYSGASIAEKCKAAIAKKNK